MITPLAWYTRGGDDPVLSMVLWRLHCIERKVVVGVGFELVQRLGKIGEEKGFFFFFGGRFYRESCVKKKKVRLLRGELLLRNFYFYFSIVQKEDGKFDQDIMMSGLLV